MSQETANIRAFTNDVEQMVNVLNKRMKKWKRGEPRPTMAEIVHEAWEKSEVTK